MISNTGALIIAHRGASGYLPEHTLAAKALAYGMGADYLEQDLVATRDDQVIVSHDVHLDRVTDVARRFPDRARADGRYYARDLDLAEIRSLKITERLDAGGNPVFPGRFPVHTGSFGVNTLAEELTFVEGLNRATGRRIGIYPEIKAPAWHREEGVDLAALTLSILADFGYEEPGAPVFLQCFDWTETQRIRRDLGCSLPMIQLIADPAWQESATDYAYLLTREGLADVAAVADGIGPWLNQLYEIEVIELHEAFGHEQDPIDGVSFAGTFDSADTPEVKKTQYFEIMGSRGIYHEGWMASTFGPRTTWVWQCIPIHSGAMRYPMALAVSTNLSSFF